MRGYRSTHVQHVARSPPPHCCWWSRCRGPQSPNKRCSRARKRSLSADRRYCDAAVEFQDSPVGEEACFERSESCRGSKLPLQTPAATTNPADIVNVQRISFFHSSSHGEFAVSSDHVIALNHGSFAAVSFLDSQILLFLDAGSALTSFVARQRLVAASNRLIRVAA